MAMGFTAAVLLSGYFAQRIGFKRTILSSFSIILIALFFMQYASTYLSFSLICLFIGLGAGMYLPSAVPLLTEIFGRRHWGKVLSIHDSGASFSLLTTPILIALALRAFHWRSFFLALCGFCILFALIFAIACPDVSIPMEKKGKFRDLIPRRDFWIMALLLILASATSLGVYNILPLFLVNERGIPLSAANTILGFSRIGGLFAGLISGFLVDRFGARKILILLMGAIGLFTVLLSFVRDFPILAAILLLQGTFAPAVFPAGFVAVSKITAPEERSIFMGSSIAFGAAIGLGLTPLLLGLIAEWFSFQTGIAMLGFIAVLSCLPLRGFPKI